MAGDSSSKPTVLIVGGLGYIGRFLAAHLHDNNLASDVRIVDKVLPQLAWLPPEFEDACAGNSKFMQADASREGTFTATWQSFCLPIRRLLIGFLRETERMNKIFDRTDGKEFDYVFNCGGETRYSQEDEVYKLRSLALSLAVGREAAKRKVKCFVELSTGMVYKADSSPSKEQDKLKPWSKIAVFKLQAEEELAKIEG
jgi:nucleoside-diphosphate-sugar epimerase